jgi:tRNA pseudouridine55 synthase
MEGALLVDKPVGWTSFDVVNYIRTIVANAEGKRRKNVKVGHIGTLDPFATGLLVILVGKNFTKQAMNLSKLDKTYEVHCRLGQVSTTGDPEGEIRSTSDLIPDLTSVTATLRSFEGEIEQTPPMHSAIKINGQRAYALARQGLIVEMPKRMVTISEIKLKSYDYPEISFTASVSSGTYIRSLVGDIGEILTTGAYTTELRRTRIGTFKIVGALDVKGITQESLQRDLRNII